MDSKIITKRLENCAKWCENSRITFSIPSNLRKVLFKHFINNIPQNIEQPVVGLIKGKKYKTNQNIDIDYH